MHFNQFSVKLWPALYSALYPFVSTSPHPNIHGVCRSRTESGTMTQTSRDPMITMRWVGNTVLSSVAILSLLSRKDKAIRGLTCGTELVLHGTRLTVHYSTPHVCVTYLINLLQINQRSGNRTGGSTALASKARQCCTEAYSVSLNLPFSQHVCLILMLYSDLSLGVPNSCFSQVFPYQSCVCDSCPHSFCISNTS
jgi:hypothetical protein